MLIYLHHTIQDQQKATVYATDPIHNCFQSTILDVSTGGKPCAIVTLHLYMVHPHHKYLHLCTAYIIQYPPVAELKTVFLALPFDFDVMSVDLMQLI